MRGLKSSHFISIKTLSGGQKISNVLSAKVLNLNRFLNHFAMHIYTLHMCLNVFVYVYEMLIYNYITPCEAVT